MPRQPAHNLPSRLTSFVGREREIAEIGTLVRRERLITLVGAPGVGKTRLSLQIATGVLDQFPDGVWLVELAPLADPTLVPRAVADVLGVREQPGRALTATLADWLRPRRLLILLDNCEHLVGAVAALTETLLRACPDLHILATSREPLAIEGEVTRRVPSLSVPDIAQWRGSSPSPAHAVGVGGPMVGVMNGRG
jgi:predicted ATPase